MFFFILEPQMQIKLGTNGVMAAKGLICIIPFKSEVLEFVCMHTGYFGIYMLWLPQLEFDCLNHLHVIYPKLFYHFQMLWYYTDG
jgi:hypothetical protein